MGTTINESLATFLLDCQARNLRPATLDTYRIQLGLFAKFCNEIDAPDLLDITPNLIRSYFITCQARGVRPASIRSYARCIQAFLSFCMDEGLLHDSPYQHIRLPKENHHKPDAYTPDQVRRLLDACNNQRNRAIIICMLDTGCRMSEFLALRVGDVDMTTGIVHLRRSTKNRADRTVFLGQRARAALAAYLAETPELPPDAPLWRPRGAMTALSDETLQSIFKRIGNVTGIKPCGPHKMRRTFALWSLRQGMDIYTVAGLMGHSTIDMLKHYIFLSDDDLQHAHEQHGPVDHMMGKAE